MMSYIQRDKNSEKRKKQPTKRTSHEEVYTYFVGTGVLDCPIARKIDTQKAKNNPDRFSKSVGGSLLYPENHQQCWWFQKALAMRRKNTSFDV